VVPVVRRLLVLILALALSGCAAVCDDCFKLEIGQYDGTWTDCCSYERQAQADAVLIRITRTSNDAYLAGLGVGCAWDEAGLPYEAPLVTVDAVEVDSTATFNVEFTEDDNQAVLGIDCQPARPEPQYPDVVLYLKDPDLGSQYDPEGFGDEDARLRILAVVVP
jgi:hypothetical protein